MIIFPLFNFGLKIFTVINRGVGIDPYRLYNLDVFEYRLDTTMALYGSIPFMMSQKKGKSTAIFWLNSSETWVDIDNSPPSSVRFIYLKSSFNSFNYYNKSFKVIKIN